MEYKSCDTALGTLGSMGDLLKQHDPWGEGLRRAGDLVPRGLGALRLRACVAEGASTEVSGRSPPTLNLSVTWDSARMITPVTTVTVWEGEPRLTLGIPERKVGGGEEALGLSDVRRGPGEGAAFPLGPRSPVSRALAGF